MKLTLVVVCIILSLILGGILGYEYQLYHIQDFTLPDTPITKQQAYDRILRARNSHLPPENEWEEQVIKDYDAVLDWIERQ